MLYLLNQLYLMLFESITWPRAASQGAELGPPRKCNCGKGSTPSGYAIRLQSIWLAPSLLSEELLEIVAYFVS